MPKSNPSPGTVLIAADTPIPEWFRFDLEDHRAWKTLLHADVHAVELTAVAAGWRFSLIVREIQARAAGLAQQSVMNHAITKAMQQVTGFGFNAFEITHVGTRHLVGLLFVDVVGNPRYLRPSPLPRELDPRCYPYPLGHFEDIFWKAAERQREIKGS